MNLKTQPKKNLPRLVQDAAVQKHRSWFYFFGIEREEKTHLFITACSWEFVPSI
jgi:hypothetical protein